MEQEELDKQLLETETPSRLPEVPTEVPVPASRKSHNLCYSIISIVRIVLFIFILSSCLSYFRDKNKRR
jgi:hypothetical protein